MIEKQDVKSGKQSDMMQEVMEETKMNTIN